MRAIFWPWNWPAGGCPTPIPPAWSGSGWPWLEPGRYGASEMAVDPIPVDGAGPHYRILAVEPHPTDRRRRIVRFEWTVREEGRARILPDRFEFAMNDPTRSDDDARGLAAMMREPDRLVVRRECLGG